MSDPGETQSPGYGGILKASSLIGGAQGVSLLVGMVRVKCAAVLIGAGGVGLMGTYQAIQGVVGTLSGLGIQSSGVRDVAVAAAAADADRMGRTVLSLRRVCWLTGLLGALMMGAVAVPLSRTTFGSSEHAGAIVVLSVVVLFGTIQGGQTALIQGMRQIGTLAWLNVVGAVGGTVLSISLYVWLGRGGIVPSLLAMAGLTLASSWWYARQLPVPAVSMNWRESLRSGAGMASLGLAFMWSSLMAALVAYATRALIARHSGLEAVGLFSAAFNLSGMFVGFVLTAMAADYFPRLTGVAASHEATNRLVNEQTEIGLLLSLPGLLATLALAPWVIRVFYTAEFLPATGMLQWFVLGCLGRVISWPMGFIMMAQGRSRWFAISETAAAGVHLTLIWLGLRFFGLEGPAVAFCTMYVLYTAGVLVLSRRLTGFQWSPATKRLLLELIPLLLAVFLVSRLLPLWPATLSGAAVAAGTGMFCLREVARRLGENHRVVRLISRIPGLRRVCGLPLVTQSG